MLRASPNGTREANLCFPLHLLALIYTNDGDVIFDFSCDEEKGWARGYSRERGSGCLSSVSVILAASGGRNWVHPSRGTGRLLQTIWFSGTAMSLDAEAVVTCT